MNPKTQLRFASILEGVSLLVLVLIAMPLKHALGMPMAVRVVGGLHGMLFVVLLLSALRAHLEGSVEKGLLAKVVGLSLLPFGFLFADRRLREPA